MRNNFILFLSVSLLLFLFSCDKEDTRLVDFFVEFATMSKKESTITFELDNGKILTPSSYSDLDIKDGDRVILNYTPIDKGLINVNSVRRILLDIIKEQGYPDKLNTSPIKIISVWVSGKYLNMSYQIDYHSIPHTAAILRDMNTDKPTLYFSYSRRDDPPGAPTLTYSSFNLESLQGQDFTIYINTHEGERKFDFKLIKLSFLIQ